MLWVYDLAGGPVRKSKPQNVAHERYLYLTDEERASTDKETQVVEEFLARIEGDAAGAFRRMVIERSPRTEDKCTLSWFVAALMLRTPQILGRTEDLNRQLLISCVKAHAEGRSNEFDEFSPDQAGEALALLESGELQVTVERNQLLDQMCKGIKDFSRTIFDHEWHFIWAPTGSAFVGGDGSYVIDDDARGANGPEASVFYFPLGRDVCLRAGPGGGGVSHHMVSNRVVRELNLATFYQSKRLVVGSSRRLLESLARRLSRGPTPSFIVDPDVDTEAFCDKLLRSEWNDRKIEP